MKQYSRSHLPLLRACELRCLHSIHARFYEWSSQTHTHAHTYARTPTRTHTHIPCILPPPGYHPQKCARSRLPLENFDKQTYRWEIIQGNYYKTSFVETVNFKTVSFSASLGALPACLSVYLSFWPSVPVFPPISLRMFFKEPHRPLLASVCRPVEKPSVEETVGSKLYTVSAENRVGRGIPYLDHAGSGSVLVCTCSRASLHTACYLVKYASVSMWHGTCSFPCGKKPLSIAVFFVLMLTWTLLSCSWR